MATFSAFPNVIAALLQQGFLARELEEGLDSVLAYRRLALQETFPGRIGETLTRTRKGRRVPIQTSMIPTAALDNGMTTTGVGFSIEQYTFTMAEYADTLDLNLMASEAEIADQFIGNARNLAVQAAQSLERICRWRLFSAYLGGNTRMIADPGATIVSGTSALQGSVADGATGTMFHFDDTRGFATVLVNGVVTPVSTSNPLNCTITSAAGTTYAVQVVLVTPYTYQSGKKSTDVTNTPDAIPGFCSIKNISGGPYVAAVGDAIVSNSGPAVLRPFNRLHTNAITGGDVLSLGIIEDGVAYLRDNGVPAMDDGTYHCILDNTSMRQLFADQDFKTLFMGRNQSTEFKDGEIIQLLGITYIPTTEAYVQQPIAAGKPKIRRPIIAGAEAIIQSNFEGMETYLSSRGFDRNDSNIAMVDGVLQIVREPLDRLQQMVAQTWTWIGDYAVPTDMTADNTIIPTASTAMYKRCVAIEHAG